MAFRYISGFEAQIFKNIAILPIGSTYFARASIPHKIYGDLLFEEY